MELQLSLEVEIRPLREGDLDDLDWDSEQAIDADYIRKVLAGGGDEHAVFLLAQRGDHPSPAPSDLHHHPEPDLREDVRAVVG